MARLGDKSKLLEFLAETPIVTFACKKVGLDRTTYYRWRKDDKDFRDQADKFLSIGRMRINDMAESVIIKKINADDTRCSIFWLAHNDPRYKPVRTSYEPPVGHRHELAPGEMCRSCGYLEPAIEEYEKGDGQKMSSDQLSKELFKRLMSLNTRKQSELEIKKIINDFIQANNIDDVKVVFEDFGENTDSDKNNEDETSKI